MHSSMNYFFAANFVLLIGSIYTIRTLVIQCSKDRPILARVLGFGRYHRIEYRFFHDFFFSMGIIYTFLCSFLLLTNCIGIWRSWGLYTVPNYQMIGEFLCDRQIFFYLLTAIGLAIAFFILPDRTMKLANAQPAFISFSLSWLSISLLGIFLCRY